jgi:hypothetical protein
MQTTEELGHGLNYLLFSTEMTGGYNEVMSEQAVNFYLSTLKNRWFQALYTEDYESLRQNIALFNTKDISTERLFSYAGAAILGWSIEDAPTIAPLMFICANVEESMLQETLTQNNYSMVEGFILTETGLDKYRPATPSALHTRYLKFKQLLTIDYVGVRKFMEAHEAVPWLGASVKLEYQHALADYESEVIPAPEISPALISHQDLNVPIEQQVPSEKYLDALARLLAAHSEDVAVAIIQGQLCVTANELYKSSKNKKITQAIESIMHYFHTLAMGTADAEERFAVFLKICSKDRISRVSSVLVSKSFHEHIVKEVLSGHDPYFSELEALYSDHSMIAAMLYAGNSCLYTDFLALETSFLSPEYAPWVDVFKQPYQLLKMETVSGVPAALQMLSGLLSRLPAHVSVDECPEPQADKPVLYIGVSNPSTACRIFLETANQVLENHAPFNIQLKCSNAPQKGADSPWKLPDIFQTEFQSNHPHPLAERIALTAKPLLEPKVISSVSTPDSSSASESDSDSESAAETERVSRLQFLNRQLACVKMLESRNIHSVDSGIVMFRMGLDLHKLNSFLRFNDQVFVYPIVKEQALRSFVRFKEDFNKSGFYIIDAMLLDILKNPFFTENISKYFQSLSVEDLGLVEPAILKRKQPDQSIHDQATDEDEHKCKISRGHHK